MAWTRRILAVGVLIGLAWLGKSQLLTARLTAKIDQLEKERTELVEYARRLGSSRRVSQVNVFDQCLDAERRIVSRMRWQEIGADGLLGAPVELQTTGELVYFEALVIKFEQQLVGEGDPDRGASLALFRRIFGENQVPDSALLFDRAAPAMNSTAWTLDSRERSSVTERAIWGRFWELIDDPELAKALGVRIAQVEAPAVPVRAGQVWEVTLDAAGGLNLRKLAEVPRNDLHWCPVPLGGPVTTAASR